MNSVKRRTPRGLSSVLGAFLTLGLCLASCAPQPVFARGASLTLATFSENSVDVTVKLQRSADGRVLLLATFTPESGYHVYSKDMPRQGVGGQGRPTLLELTANSRMQSVGALTDSIEATVNTISPSGALLISYPEGPVTLTIPVSLPAGNAWTDDEISLTYMACKDTSCKVPVIGKSILVKVPGSAMLDE